MSKGKRLLATDLHLAVLTETIRKVYRRATAVRCGYRHGVARAEAVRGLGMNAQSARLMHFQALRSHAQSLRPTWAGPARSFNDC